MGHRPHRVLTDKLAAHQHGNAITAADVGASLDHRGYRRVHPPGTKADDPSLPGRLLASGSLCRDTRGLTEKTKDCSFVQTKICIHPLDLKDMLIDLKDCSLGHGPDIDLHSFEQAQTLFNACKDPPLPLFRKILGDKLGLHPFVDPFSLEYLDSPVKIDVCGPSRLDILKVCCV